MTNITKTLCLGAAMMLALSASAQNEKVKDLISPLSDHSIQLHGYFDNDIHNSVEHWNKGVVPYDRLMEFYDNNVNRPNFAVGEMWAKAVRSGAMLYAYNKDPELKKILVNTVNKVFNVSTKHIFYFLRSNFSVLNNVMKKSRANGFCIHSHFCKNFCNCKRMDNVRLT